MSQSTSRSAVELRCSVRNGSRPVIRSFRCCPRAGGSSWPCRSSRCSSCASTPSKRKYRISSAPRTRRRNSWPAMVRMVPPRGATTIRSVPAECAERFAAAARSGRELLLFGGVLADRPGELMLDLAEALGRGDRCAARERYRRLFAVLAEAVELGTLALAPGGRPVDAWQAHLVERLLSDENPFSRKCETAGAGTPGPATVAAARADLSGLRLPY